MKRWVPALVLVVACQGGVAATSTTAEVETTTSTITSTTTTTTTTTTLPPTTATSAEEVPIPDLTVDDPAEAMRRIVEFLNWLEQHPDPALLDVILWPECECAYERVDVETFVLEPWVVEPVHQPRVIESIAVLENDGTTARLAYTDMRVPFDVAYADGTNVIGIPGWQPTERIITLRRDDNDAWRILDTEGFIDLELTNG